MGEQEIELTHVSLFTGIGGFDLAAMAAGFTTQCFVETDLYCRQILEAQFPEIPILGDIRNVTEEIISNTRRQYYEGHLYKGKHASTHGHGPTHSFERSDRAPGDSFSLHGEFPPITLITAGVPCQPSSQSGQRRGTTDDRWLWPEAIRILFEIRPLWAVFENPYGILTLEKGMVFEALLLEMGQKGYELQSFIIPACGVNAPHRRDRVFIVAHDDRPGQPWPCGDLSSIGDPSRRNNPCNCSKTVPDSESILAGGLSFREGKKESGLTNNCQIVTLSQILGLEGDIHRQYHNQESAEQPGAYSPRGNPPTTSIPDSDCSRWPSPGSRNSEQAGEQFKAGNRGRPEPGATQPGLGGMVDGFPPWLDSSWWDREPELPRVATGVKDRAQRLKALGNAVIPAQVFPILEGIAWIERLRQLGG